MTFTYNRSNILLTFGKTTVKQVFKNISHYAVIKVIIIEKKKSLFCLFAEVEIWAQLYIYLFKILIIWCFHTMCTHSTTILSS